WVKSGGSWTTKYRRLLGAQEAVGALVVKRGGGGTIRSVMPKIQFTHSYEDIISLDNLLSAWPEFSTGKRKRKDVQEFARNLMTNIISLHSDLAAKTYQHSAYEAFNIADPKPRNIHKASVRDRLLHHALYRKLYPFFDRTFIADSFSCRRRKGTHKAVKRFERLARKASQNNTKTLWVLKCDIRKFFASIEQTILLDIVNGYIPDKNIVWLIGKIVLSFHSTAPGKGLPLGNLTSQLLVNIYMNEFDQFVKHKLKVKYYIRYADDFVVMSTDKKWLEEILLEIRGFLEEKLKLKLHPDKVFIKTIASGVDFLGWVHFPDHRVLRTMTKRRMFRNIKEKEGKVETVQSYLGLLRHGNGWKLQREIFVSLKKEYSGPRAVGAGDLL
ncbi:MAG: reverse transcriptase/maturase family protein, partial [Patescibacteria group bacterium]